MNTEFNKKSDYKEQESSVLYCANYVLDNPLVEEDIKRQVSTQFILKWMTGTPDYTFSLGEEFAKLGRQRLDVGKVMVIRLWQWYIARQYNM